MFFFQVRTRLIKIIVELFLNGAYTEQSHTKQSHTKQSETSKKDSKKSPIQNSPKPVEFLDLDLLAPTELIYALKTQTGVIKDQRAKVGTIIRVKIKRFTV